MARISLQHFRTRLTMTDFRLTITDHHICQALLCFDAYAHPFDIIKSYADFLWIYFKPFTFEHVDFHIWTST